VSTAVTFGIIIVVLALFSLASSRNRRRRLTAESDRVASLGVGAEVMTTSGLYGTVVARNEDDSVLLSIAPGVEVRWAAAALRTVDELPDRYRPKGADEERDREPGPEDSDETP
jgi:preprotein translocase subunit YajC